MTLIRPALVLLAVFLVVGFAGVAYQGVRTLQTLTAVEAERDQWQRPGDIIKFLNLNDGSVVVDLGSGAGYFALKLSDAVGAGGEVIAVDLRSWPLLFLRIRALVQRKHNIRIIVGDPDNPYLPAAGVDSALIVNTYHEMNDPQSILRHIALALHPSGRLVIVDRKAATDRSTPENGEHYIFPEVVEADLRTTGFKTVNREDSLLQGPEGDLWWLILAVKP